jgi:inward rectifier potassium channel
MAFMRWITRFISLSSHPLKRGAPTRRRRSSIVHIQIQNGRFQILGLETWYSYWKDPYHLLLTVPWGGFVGLVALAYVSTNALFALAYLAMPGSIENARPGSFWDAFFFSVQTLASIGYGAMYPKTAYANAIVTIEAMVALVGVALLTGLAFARFARPTARVLFSQIAVVASYEEVPTLMFRTANQRRNQILEAQMRVYLMRDEVTREGQAMRRFYDLRLLRQRTPSFTLSWTAMHPIDEYSPLYGATQESLIQGRATIVISLSGIDQTVAQMIHARHTYTAHEILWNHRFVDIFHNTPDGHRYIDYSHFHETVPLT